MGAYVVRPDERIRTPNTISVYLQAVARLKPGVSVEQAQAHMHQISAALTSEHPVWNTHTRAGVRPLHDHVVGTRTAQCMLLLLGAVFIVLMIACANVANLLLAGEEHASGRSAIAPPWVLAVSTAPSVDRRKPGPVDAGDPACGAGFVVGRRCPEKTGCLRAYRGSRRLPSTSESWARPVGCSARCRPAVRGLRLHCSSRARI